jgi:hypothetical protein
MVVSLAVIVICQLPQLASIQASFIEPLVPFKVDSSLSGSSHGLVQNRRIGIGLVKLANVLGSHGPLVP